jgi:uncharacterized membrane protein required for colicin V production
MVIVSIIAIIVLIASFLGGAKEGAVRHFFSLVAVFIAIPLTGIAYKLLATLLSFIPGENWENFIGFFITFAIIIVMLHFIFLPPRKIIEKIWKKGCLFRIIGGLLNTFNASIGLVVFYLVLREYPIIDWLERAVIGSGVMVWLVNSLGFVAAMLPEEFGVAVNMVAVGLGVLL